MEIIKQVTERTGISETQAQQAVAGLNDSFRSNLPSPIADVIGGLLSGSAPATQGRVSSTSGGINADDALGALGSLVGGGQDNTGQGAGLDDLLGGLLGGSSAGREQGNANQGTGLDDLLGGLLGGSSAGGAQDGFGLDDILGMIGGNAGDLNLDRLVESVTGQAGVSPDIATVIVQTVLQFLGEHLPEPLGSALSSIIGGQPGSSSNDDGFGIDDIARGLGGLLGGS
ncbi:MAG: hypothetical protein IH587_06390 [Anaerolineae bacterium]|nr:hypothetical protein [Anaerolineae bacterium]